jgi:hypothetical protein
VGMYHAVDGSASGPIEVCGPPDFLFSTPWDIFSNAPGCTVCNPGGSTLGWRIMDGYVRHDCNGFDVFFHARGVPCIGDACDHFIWHSVRVKRDACVTDCDRGACCCGGNCWGDVTAAECAAMGGTFKGVGVQCYDVECPQACCLPAGCTDLTPAECLAAGGTPTLNRTCAVLGPLACTGACCVLDGFQFVCSQKTQAECAALSGEWKGIDSHCGIHGICLAPLGACCVFCADNCTETTIYGCMGWGSTWHGEGTECSSVTCPPVGACCKDGGCTQTTEGCCVQFTNGTWQGAGTPCTPNPCAPTGTGACCFSSGESSSCTDGMTAAECAGSGGFYKGDNSECASVECPLCTACCVPAEDGYECLEGLTQDECVNGYGGNWSSLGGCPGTPCATAVVCSIDGDPEETMPVRSAAQTTFIANPNPCSKCGHTNDTEEW